MEKNRKKYKLQFYHSDAHDLEIISYGRSNEYESVRLNTGYYHHAKFERSRLHSFQQNVRKTKVKVFTTDRPHEHLSLTQTRMTFHACQK